MSIKSTKYGNSSSIFMSGGMCQLLGETWDAPSLVLGWLDDKLLSASKVKKMKLSRFLLGRKEVVSK